jgi:CheY-like chemotaxis protein
MDKETGKTILVVDDEPDIRIFLQTLLEDEGFNVITADNGKHALDKIQEKKPDLISLDLVMPKMRGVKLLAYLQKNKELANIPFIIVTAHAGDELGKKDLIKLKTQNIVVGPHSFIEKPVVPSEYIKKVREALGLSADSAEYLKEKIQDGLKSASTDKLQKALDALKEEDKL